VSVLLLQSLIELIESSRTDRDGLCEELEQRELKTINAVSKVPLFLSELFCM